MGTAQKDKLQSIYALNLNSLQQEPGPWNALEHVELTALLIRILTRATSRASQFRDPGYVDKNRHRRCQPLSRSPAGDTPGHVPSVPGGVIKSRPAASLPNGWFSGESSWCRGYRLFLNQIQVKNKIRKSPCLQSRAAVLLWSSPSPATHYTEQIFFLISVSVWAPGQAQFGISRWRPRKTNDSACVLQESRIWTFSWEKERREKASAMKAIFYFVLVLQLVNYPSSHHRKKTCYKKKKKKKITFHFKLFLQSRI